VLTAPNPEYPEEISDALFTIGRSVVSERSASWLRAWCAFLAHRRAAITERDSLTHQSRERHTAANDCSSILRELWGHAGARYSLLPWLWYCRRFFWYRTDSGRTDFDSR
jgi:hypothetical protein